MCWRSEVSPDRHTLVEHLHQPFNRQIEGPRLCAGARTWRWECTLKVGFRTHDTHAAAQRFKDLQVRKRKMGVGCLHQAGLTERQNGTGVAANWCAGEHSVCPVCPLLSVRAVCSVLGRKTHRFEPRTYSRREKRNTNAPHRLLKALRGMASRDHNGDRSTPDLQGRRNVD